MVRNIGLLCGRRHCVTQCLLTRCSLANPNYVYSPPRRRGLSDIAKVSSTDIAAEASITSGNLMRHGPGDAVIILNVGGKEFCTLRSTVSANAILAEHVARAEANQEFTHKGAAVFIDRDPAYFQLVLNHLRNKVEGISYGHSCKASENHVRLPEDKNALRDIYVEACHYQIPELQAASCKGSLIVTIMEQLGGGTNPFDQASKLLLQFRRGLVAMGSLGTVAIGSQQDLDKMMATLFPVWFKKEEEEPKEDLKQIPEG